MALVQGTLDLPAYSGRSLSGPLHGYGIATLVNRAIRW